MKVLTIGFVTLLLAGCDLEVYRYPCQNPDNWKSEECQKPLCEVSGTCPEHIFKGQSNVIKTIEEQNAKEAAKQLIKEANKK